MANKSPFEIRGTVEGFYGEPWSHATRLRMLRFTAEMGMNAYIYAPKDDPFHRERWREDYPPEEERRLRELIAGCRREGMMFCWALSPGLSVRYASREDFRLLVEKFRWVMRLGARQVALFLDDIPDVLQHAVDKKRYESLAAAQSDLVNRLHDALRDIDPEAELLFCPTEYIGTQPSPYLDTIGRLMRPEVGIFWTGPLVVSPSITMDDARAISAVLRRKPLLWDNYPVNDYNRRRLNMGPIRSRDAGLADCIAGYFANPMNEAEASKPALLTIGDYLCDPRGYDPDASWDRALRKFGGAEHAAALRLFSEQHRVSFFVDEPPAEISILCERADIDISAGRRLRAYALKLVDAAEELKTFPSPAFRKEIQPHLRAMRDRALLLIDTLDMLSIKDSVKRKIAATGLRRRLDAVLARRYQTAAGVIDAFIERCVQRETK